MVPCKQHSTEGGGARNSVGHYHYTCVFTVQTLFIVCVGEQRAPAYSRGRVQHELGLKLAVQALSASSGYCLRINTCSIHVSYIIIDARRQRSERGEHSLSRLTALGLSRTRAAARDGACVCRQLPRGEASTMIDDRTSAGPRAWHPTYRIDHVSPSGKKPVTVASISDAEREG